MIFNNVTPTSENAISIIEENIQEVSKSNLFDKKLLELIFAIENTFDKERLKSMYVARGKDFGLDKQCIQVLKSMEVEFEKNIYFDENRYDVVPNFSKIDFKNEVVYDWLYSFKDNPFKQEQLKDLLQEKAKKLGVSNFIKFWNSYKMEISKKTGISLENSTDFDGQELELQTGKYFCDNNGISFQGKNNEQIEVCKHPIMPVQRLINIDSGEERLRIAYRKGWQWRNTIEEKITLASSSSILNLASKGVFVTSENAKILSSYLFELEQINYDIIPEKKSVGRLGWVGEGLFSPYVDGLEFDGEQSFKHLYECIEESGNFEKWIEVMKEVRKNGIEARIYLASSFASVLLEPLGLTSFFVHLWGGTENGKTVALMVAASVWGSPKVGDYVTTFNSTSVAQELQAGFLNSLPLCLDELQIQSSQGIKDFDKMIYQLTEGAGKSRGAKTGGLQKQQKWKNCILTNGESPISNINSGGGAVNRILEFECENKIYHDLPYLCNVINENYGFAGKVFVEHLKTESAIEDIKTLQKQYYEKLLNTESTEKQAGAASAVLVADHIITKLIFKDDNQLTINDLTQVMTKRDDVNVNFRAYEFIFEWVAQNKAHFVPGDFGYTTDVWGCVENEEIYIIKSVFDREMKNHGFNATSFLSWAKRNNKIDFAKDRTTKKKRINSSVQPIWCVCIKKIDNFIEINQPMEDFDFPFP